MATNVTVLGAGGSTVTIPFTSAANASAAQAALVQINSAVQLGFMEQQNISGTGGVAGPSSTFLVGAIATGSATVNAGAAPASTILLATNNTTQVTMTGAANPMTVVAGTGGAAFINISTGLSKVFFGGGNGTYVGTDSTRAQINVDDKNNAIWDYGVGGKVTVNSFDGSTANIIRGNATSSGGQVSVRAQSGASVVVTQINLGKGASAATIDGGSSKAVAYFGSASSSALIFGGSSNITVGNSSGAISLVGGTGSHMVFGAHGSIEGGSGGKNYLRSDSLAGATTLVGSGSNDTLVSQGAGNTIAAFGSNALIADVSGGTGGVYSVLGGGSSTVLGSLGAKSDIYAGAGTVFAYGQHGPALTVGSTYYDAFNGANVLQIGDFVAGLDFVSLTKSASGASLSSVTYYDSVGTSTFGQVGSEAILSDGTKIQFINSVVTKASFT